MIFKTVLQLLLRLVRRIIDALRDLADEITADPVAMGALEADLGLPPGSLKNFKPPEADLSGIDAYIKAISPTGEQFAVALEGIQAYVGFWKNIIKAGLAGDTTRTADELVYRLFQLTATNVIKYNYPTTYYLMRMLGVFVFDLRLSLEESFLPDAAASLFTAEYYENFVDSFRRGYLGFRLDQTADIILAEPDPGNPPTPEEQLLRNQLGFKVYGLSDLIYVAVFVLSDLVFKTKLEMALGLKIEQFYGWELPPGGGAPLSERIASRGYTLKLTNQLDPTVQSAAILTQFFEPDAQGHVGWMVSVGGELAFEGILENETRPLKVKYSLGTPQGFSIHINAFGEDHFSIGGLGGVNGKFLLEPEKPVAALGKPVQVLELGPVRLEMGDFALKVEITNEGAKAQFLTSKNALIILPDDADSFVKNSIPPKGVRIEFDLGMAVDETNGFYLTGGGRLSTTIPIGKSVAGLTAESLQLSLNPVSSPTGSELRFTASAVLALDIGAFHMLVDGIGMMVNLGFSRKPPPPDADALLPFMYLRDTGFKPPNGVGVLVDSDIVTGGGFLFFDREKEQYAGVLELQIGSRLSLKAIGLLTTRLPDGSKGFSLLVILSIEFDPPLPVPFLPFLNIGGVGGLLGLHRTVDVDVLRAGLRNRTLDAILFPKDPVANAARYLSVLGGVFPPARGHNLFGFSLILGIGQSGIFKAELEIIIETGPNPRTILLGQLHVLAPAKGDKHVLEVHADFIGVWDKGRGEFSLDARLYDSRLAFIVIYGDLALRSRSGDDPFFLLSIGGYHPAFAVPPNFPKLERLTVKFADSKNLRLILTGYFATSSNTRQAGGKFDFFVGFAGFSIEGFLQIDVLWEPDVRFLADFDIKVALKYKGRTLLGAHAVGQFTGPEPKRLKGEVSIDLFLFSIEKSFDKTFGEDRPPSRLAGIDALPELVAALQDPRSWEASLPAGSQPLVSLKANPGGKVRVHPLGELSVRQMTLPLGITIDRFAGGVPSGERRFTITGATIGDDEVTERHPLNEFFAMAEFIEMSDDEKLSRPSFESMPAGLVLQPGGLAFGGQDPPTAGQAAVSEMDFDEKIIAADGSLVTPGGKPGLLFGELALAAAAFGPAGRSLLRTTGSAHFQAPGPGLQVRRQRYAAAGVDDLAAVSIDGGPLGSFTEVQQALDRHLAANPQAKGRIQVVPVFEVEETP